MSYFHAADSTLAVELADITRKYFDERGCPLESLRLRHLLALSARVPRGQVELWVNTNCRG